MKKYFLIGITLFIFVSVVYASLGWTCYNYVNGKATGGWISITANTRQEAEAKAVDHYRNELKLRSDYCKCR